MAFKHWYNALNKVDDAGNNKGNKLCTLAKVKSKFEIETYVTLLPLKARRDFAKLRTSSHSLEIEVGRYFRPKIPRERRICKQCNLGEVEDELHHLLKCTFFREIRTSHLLNLAHSLPFTVDQSPECFNQLLSCYNGNPQVTRVVCNLVKALGHLRYEIKLCTPQIRFIPTVTKVAGGGGRIIKPPDRLNYSRL